MIQSNTRPARRGIVIAIAAMLAGCAAEMGDPADYYGEEVPPYDDDLEAADPSGEKPEVGIYEEGSGGEGGEASAALFGEVIVSTSAKCADEYPAYASRMRDVALRQPNAGLFATASGGDVVFDRNWIDDREKFALVDLGGGEVGILDRHCRFLSAIGGGGGAVVADKTWLFGWETFQMTRQSGARVQLRTQTGHYLYATGWGALNAYSPTARSLVLVELEDTRKVAIHVGPMGRGDDFRLLRRDGDYLKYDDRLDLRSTFSVIDLGLGETALRVGNGPYLRACSGGGSCVRSDRWRMAGHERFVVEELLYYGWGAVERVKIQTANHHWFYDYGATVTATADDMSHGTNLYFIPVDDEAPVRALYSTYKSRYVRAEPDGDLKADAGSIDDWEKYRVIERGQDDYGRRRIALRNHHGRYLRAVGGGGGELVADRYYADTHETFTLIPASDGRYALRTHNGRYVRVLSSNDLRADSYGAGTSSLFRIVTPRPSVIGVGPVTMYSR